MRFHRRRRYRPNSDARLRELERQAALGDSQAALALDKELWRTGTAAAHYGALLYRQLQITGGNPPAEVAVPDLFRPQGILLRADSSVDPLVFSLYRARRLIAQGVPLSEQDDPHEPKPAVRYTATILPGLPLTFYGGGHMGEVPWNSWVARETIHLEEAGPEATVAIVGGLLEDVRRHERNRQARRDQLERRNGPLTWENVKKRIMAGDPKQCPNTPSECIDLLREVAPPRQKRLHVQPPNGTGAGWAWAATMSLKHVLSQTRWHGFRAIPYSGTGGPGRHYLGDQPWEPRFIEDERRADWSRYDPFSRDNTNGTWAHRSFNVTTSRAMQTQRPAEVEAIFAQFGILRPRWIPRSWFRYTEKRKQIPRGGLWRLRIGGPSTVQDLHNEIIRSIRRLFPDARIQVSSRGGYIGYGYGEEEWREV